MESEIDLLSAFCFGWLAGVCIVIESGSLLSFQQLKNSIYDYKYYTFEYNNCNAISLHDFFN
jgi:hypothetical protein